MIAPVDPASRLGAEATLPAPGWPDPGEAVGRPSGMPSPELVAGGGWGAVTAGPGRTGGPGSRSVEVAELITGADGDGAAGAGGSGVAGGGGEGVAGAGMGGSGTRTGSGGGSLTASVIVGSGVSIGLGSLRGRGGTGLGRSITRGGGSSCGGSGAVTNSTGSTGSGREA